jgi:membrane-bound lytic murein transglycosylase D
VRNPVPPQSTPDVPPLLVTASGSHYRFVESFCIGRAPDCDIRIQDVHVSRKHVSVEFNGAQWCLRDLQSGNGVFVAGESVQSVPIAGKLTISLGADGPVVSMEVEQPEPPVEEEEEAGHTVMLASYTDRYLRQASDEEDEDVGERTMMIRRAFEQVQKKQKRKHGWVVGLVAAVALAAAGYAYYGYRQLQGQEKRAEDLFYQMKAMDLQIAKVEQMVATSGVAPNPEQVKSYMDQRRQMERSYDDFLAGLSSKPLTEQERLILRVTRLFGECEIAAPSEYLREVNRYISGWKSTTRFARGVKLAQDLGYTKRIADEFLAQNLPPQFFYLALQESDFDAFNSGPPTRFGIAKGMWQFIPETGARYGLTIGPLAAVGKPDPADDRHKWEKATKAAARYIKDIYATDAQASGLLVMASYNWGEGRIINLLRSMPQNPQERNFWQVLEKHRNRVPLETYNYVFNIVAAAVIGENPRLFGIQLDNPLAFATAQ